jgi:F-type H+-transporting ATPase subunit delta
VRDRIVVQRYADAFVKSAQETMGLAECIAEAQKLRAVFRDCPELEDFLVTREISPLEKEGFLDGVLGKDFSREVVNFMKFLIRKERILNLVDILDHIRAHYAHGDEVDAVLRSATIMDLNALGKVKGVLERKLGKKLNLHLELDPSLLGGFQVMIGHTVLDGSLRRRLLEIGEKMNNARVV